MPYNKTSIYSGPQVVKSISAILSVYQYFLGKTFIWSKNVWVDVFSQRKYLGRKSLLKIFVFKDLSEKKKKFMSDNKFWSKMIFSKKNCINYAQYISGQNKRRLSAKAGFLKKQTSQ